MTRHFSFLGGGPAPSPAKAAKPHKKGRKVAEKSPSTRTVAPGRLQYAALPWRKADRLEIMLVSSRETRRWIIPKGWPMAGRSGSAAASIEAVEEAGLLGIVSNEPIGQYFYAKRFSGEKQLCRVEVYSLRVARQREDWPEKHERSTQWFFAQEAMAMVADPELSDLIADFARSFGS